MSEPRHIRSFVLRQGRTTDAQREALDTLWPRYGIDWPADEALIRTAFARPLPLVVEVGFGNGEALIAAADADRARNFLGVEVHGPGVGRALRAAAAHALENLRVIRFDAIDVLRALAPASVDEVRIYFPDPWPKVRHHKRRIVRGEVVALVAERLRLGGCLHLATDWQPYADWMREVLAAEPRFALRIDGDGHAARIETHFERRGRKLGHAVTDLVYERVA